MPSSTPPTVHSALLEAAEASAALGGVYLRVVWDSELAPFPSNRIVSTMNEVLLFHLEGSCEFPDWLRSEPTMNPMK